MRPLACIGTFLLLVASACDRGSHEANDRVLSAVSVEAAFRGLYPDHVLAPKGSSQLSGQSVDSYEKSEIFTVAGKAPLPDDFIPALGESLARQLTGGGARGTRFERTCEIRYTKDYKNLAPDSSGGIVYFSVGGSRGLITLRYTTVTAKDAIGYLSSEIVEFRK